MRAASPGEGPGSPVARGLAAKCGAVALRVLAIAVALFLAIEYLRLGYFVLFLLPLGALAAVLLTRKQRAGYPPVRSSLLVIVAYGAAVALVWSATVDNRDERRTLKWEILESPGQTKSEIRLYLDDTHYLSSFSKEFGRYLRSRSAETVPVVLPVSLSLGCFQSLGDPRIEGWGVVPVSTYTSGDGPGPWPEHWWCP